MRNISNIGFQKGKDLERGFVGNLKIHRNKEVSYLTYKDSLTQVLSLHQPEPRPIVKEIVQNIYNQYPVFKQASLQYYASLETALDYYHGVDCFFMINLSGNTYIVTIDVTQNQEKTQAKADIVIHIDYDNDGAVTLTDKSIAEVANAIAQKFRAKISRT